MRLKWKPKSSGEFEDIPAEYASFAQAKRAAFIRDQAMLAVGAGLTFFLAYPLLVFGRLPTWSFGQTVATTQVIVLALSMLLSFTAG
jgi:hypothetical protein